MTCSHSCPFRQGESLHALVWRDPSSFLHLFILITAWAERWGEEGRTHWFNSSLLRACWGSGNKQNTKSPTLVELTFSWKRGEKTQQVPSQVQEFWV